ncbi:dihydrofolate reductase family protein [Spirillospora sp. CA-255316]
MAKLTVTGFVSMDGVMQAPGGPEEDTSGGFRLGGWLVPHFDEDLGAFMDEVFQRAGAFLLGRGTYDIFVQHWPHITDPGDPVAAKLNALPKYVPSRTRDSLEWKGTTVLKGDAVKAIRDLKEAPLDGEIQVHGSHGLIQTLLAENLVDEINLIVFPVVLGSGKRLFGPGVAPGGYTRTGGRITPAGVTIGTYRRVGEVQQGAVGLDTEN